MTSAYLPKSKKRGHANSRDARSTPTLISALFPTSMFRRTIFSRRTWAAAAGVTTVAAGGGYYYLNSGPPYVPSTKESRRPPSPWTPPEREHMLEGLRASTRKEGDAYPDEFDLLIVGGGATGAGVAVDAASRGLRVALVERDDFSSGTRLGQSACGRLRLRPRGRRVGHVTSPRCIERNAVG